jgi:GNAT superfamily N-acetyltransferase
MSTAGFVIRDALVTDIQPCLGLDHTYDTDHVWQMTASEDSSQRQIIFKTERLPRTMEAACVPHADRLRRSLAADHCFLVAARRDSAEVLGYLALRSDPSYDLAHIHDLIVSRPYRRHRIGTRLLNVARQWAREHNLKQLTIELQTKNHPAALFCQQAGLRFCGFNDHYFPNQDIAIFFCQTLR